MTRWTVNIVAAISMVVSIEMIALSISSYAYGTSVDFIRVADGRMTRTGFVSEEGNFGIQTRMTPPSLHTLLLPYWLLLPVTSSPAVAWLFWHLVWVNRRKTARGFDVLPTTAHRSSE